MSGYRNNIIFALCLVLTLEMSTSSVLTIITRKLAAQDQQGENGGEQNQSGKDEATESESQQLLDALELAQVERIKEARRISAASGRYIIAFVGNPEDEAHISAYREFSTNDDCKLLLDFVVTLRIDNRLPSFENWNKAYGFLDHKARWPYACLVNHDGNFANKTFLKAPAATLFLRTVDRGNAYLSVEVAKKMLADLESIRELVSDEQFWDALEKISKYLPYVYPADGKPCRAKIIGELENLYRKSLKHVISNSEEIGNSARGKHDVDALASIARRIHEFKSRIEGLLANGDISLVESSWKSNPVLMRLIEDFEIIRRVDKNRLETDQLSQALQVLRYDIYEGTEFARSEEQWLRAELGMDVSDWQFALSDSRKWTDKSGKHSVRGSVVGVSAESVKIVNSTNFKILLVSRAELCLQDRDFVDALVKNQ